MSAERVTQRRRRFMCSLFSAIKRLLLGADGRRESCNLLRLGSRRVLRCRIVNCLTAVRLTRKQGRQSDCNKCDSEPRSNNSFLAAAHFLTCLFLGRFHEGQKSRTWSAAPNWRRPDHALSYATLNDGPPNSHHENQAARFGPASSSALQSTVPAAHRFPSWSPSRAVSERLMGLN